MSQYLLGLDAGNTVVKAVLFDLAGQQIAASAGDGGSLFPQTGHVERDLGALWDQAARVIGDCIAKAAINASDIAAIGCSGHGNGLYLLDSDARPLVGIQSLDSRAMQLVDLWGAEGVGDRLYPLCLQRPWPSQTPTLLAWIKRNRPDLYARTGTAFLCKDYVTYCLTGHIGSDMSDMSGCALLNINTRSYDPAIMALYGLDDAMDMLPPLAEPYDIVGSVTEDAAQRTGLKAGTPVVAGLFDVVASAIGSGAVRLGDASIVAGTWSINQIIIDKPIRDHEIFLTTDFGNGLYLGMEASATSAANLEWFITEFIEPSLKEGANPFECCNDLVSSVTPKDGLPLYHPFLYGASDNGAARAGFYGIGGWHSRADMLYALFEGVVFGHQNHIEALRRAGASFETAYLSGGGSRSPIWPQMFADILDLPVSIAACQETGALGAAIAAGIGAGLFTDYGQGARAMTRLDRHYAPQPDHQSIYRNRFALYNTLTEVMSGPWETMKNKSQ